MNNLHLHDYDDNSMQQLVNDIAVNSPFLPEFTMSNWLQLIVIATRALRPKLSTWRLPWPLRKTVPGPPGSAGN